MTINESKPLKSLEYTFEINEKFVTLFSLDSYLVLNTISSSSSV